MPEHRKNYYTENRRTAKPQQKKTITESFKKQKDRKDNGFYKYSIVKK